ncbi:MAG: YidC/Oxa1 family membrane protein insertase [Clostridia bacterium]|nr:YidC/Oxa1 family membrane protein insertase [Clostridia bacterium]
MQILSLLNSTVIPHFGQTFDVQMNWLGNLIKILISAVGVVGVGIILFSLLLKLVVLPLDIYQRITMRKQNQKMEANKEKMEKLQKQYANDKEKYNQKVVEMYKESGMSMFSSCLPMILSMVIFIFAINAFNSYSQYANIASYNTLVNAYNAHVETYAPEIEEGNYTLANNKITVRSKDAADGKYVYFEVAFTDEESTAVGEDPVAYVNRVLKNEIKGKTATYYVDTEKMYAYAETDADFKAALTAFEKTNEDGSVNKELTAAGYIRDKAQSAVVKAYEEEAKPAVSFLWIKNVWTTDAAYKHPILPYSEFIQTMEQGRESFSVNGSSVKFEDIKQYNSFAYQEDTYDEVTSKLSTQKTEANGYFILIVLSIGTILLQQFVMMRSQKAQSKYSSVDGQGASQQKMMMVMMTVMFAIFSFMYSAAFSIYMVISNVFSLLSTLVINKIVDVVLEKKEAKAEQMQYDKRFRGTARKINKDNKK